MYKLSTRVRIVQKKQKLFQKKTQSNHSKNNYCALNWIVYNYRTLDTNATRQLKNHILDYSLCPRIIRFIFLVKNKLYVFCKFSWLCAPTNLMITSKIIFFFMSNSYRFKREFLHKLNNNQCNELCDKVHFVTNLFLRPGLDRNIHTIESST